MTLGHAFTSLGLPEVVAFAFPENTASRRVLEKIGMRPEPDEDHYGHRLARYRLRADEWRRSGDGVSYASPRSARSEDQ